MDPTYFATPADFRAWLAVHHVTATALWVGYHKKGSGRPSLTWPESVDEALCFGWIDGIRKSVDAQSYMIRFTPRKTGSIWSTVNVRRVEALTELGRMQPTGLAAFQARRDGRSGVYSHEQGDVTMPEPLLTLLQANLAAWAFFQDQPGSYRKAAPLVGCQRQEGRNPAPAARLADPALGSIGASSPVHLAAVVEWRLNGALPIERWL